jgi:SAM-dependent methyltransferase
VPFAGTGSALLATGQEPIRPSVHRQYLCWGSSLTTWFPRVHLVKLQQIGLHQLETSYFDLVYSTNMLAHLDQMDRWCYVKDSFRVLRPGGRQCIDNVDLQSEEVWGAFASGTESYRGLKRRPYNPTPSTAAELAAHASRAGFLQVQVHKRSPLVIVTAAKLGPA